MQVQANTGLVLLDEAEEQRRLAKAAEALERWQQILGCSEDKEQTSSNMNVRSHASDRGHDPPRSSRRKTRALIPTRSQCEGRGWRSWDIPLPLGVVLEGIEIHLDIRRIHCCGCSCFVFSASSQTKPIWTLWVELRAAVKTPCHTAPIPE